MTDPALEARAKAAYELLRRDQDIDRLELLAAVVWPPVELENVTQAACRHCGHHFEARSLPDRYCGAECRRLGANARNRAYYERRRRLAA